MTDTDTYARWTAGRHIEWTGSNAGSDPLALQRWQHFKEAFAPELVKEIVETSSSPVARVLDPFAGSGTTPLTCQFLGIDVTAIEINPYLADVIRAKLAQHEPDQVLADHKVLLAIASNIRQPELPDDAPATLLEPGVNDRFVFHRDAGRYLLRLAQATEHLPEPSRHLFKTLLGGLLVSASNVVVNGKGRRYRRGWEDRRDIGVSGINELLAARVAWAVEDLEKFYHRPRGRHRVLLGDALDTTLPDNYDQVIFSPPYPNSFDYTDVYNLQLWMLGYLSDRSDNRNLRLSTLSSHVQLKRDFKRAPSGSDELERVLRDLNGRRNMMWNRNLPDMIAGYFADMAELLQKVKPAINQGGGVAMVLGDSQYSGVHIPVSKILTEIATDSGWRITHEPQYRVMRTSAQQGGGFELRETLLRLQPTG